MSEASGERSAAPALVLVRTARVATAGPGEPLDAAELARAARLARPRDRARFVARHALLRRVVGEATGCDPREVRLSARCGTCGGPHGKPFVEGVEGGGDGTEPPRVSLSSSGDLVVVALTHAGDVGVDVEPVSAVARHDVADALAPGEVAPSARALAVTWVRKEAVLKATGDGLVVPPSDLVVSAADQPPQLLAWRGRVRPEVAMVDLSLPAGYVGCVAVLTRRSVRVV